MAIHLASVNGLTVDMHTMKAKIYLPYQIFVGESPSGKASAFGADTRRFESCLPSQKWRHMEISALILAAGAGVRMKSKTPKVLHQILGRPMISYVLDCVRSLGIEKIGVVVGVGAKEVMEELGDSYSYIPQPSQLGTGDAVIKARTTFEGQSGYLFVLCGDTPLLRPATLKSMIDLAEAEKPSCVMLTAKVPDPTGYGRIIRDNWGAIKDIVEERDAKPEEKMIAEVNAGVYLFKMEDLWPALDKITPDNDQKEYYLTDVIEILFQQEKTTVSVRSTDLDEYRGINDRWQLAEITGNLLIKRLKDLAMSGVIIIDPGSTYIEASVDIAPDVIIYPQTYLAGKMSIGEGCEIGPFVFLNGKKDGITIGDNVKVGPFVRMRPLVEVEDSATIGCFIDLKKSKIGKGSKVPHLTYLGDCEVGEKTNIGAGTITCNYDGTNKSKTKIGNNVFIGSDTMLVAPVEIGDGAYTGAGSVITKNVPEDSLAIERSPMVIKEGWAKKKKEQNGGGK